MSFVENLVEAAGEITEALLEQNKKQQAPLVNASASADYNNGSRNMVNKLLDAQNVKTEEDYIIERAQQRTKSMS